MPTLGVPELLIILVIVLLLFGSKKLPEAARSIGKSMRIFKAETRGLKEDEQARAAEPRSLPPVRADEPVVDGRPREVDRERSDYL